MATEFTPETVKGWLVLSPFIAFMRLDLVRVDAQKSEVVMKMPMRSEFERGGHIGAQFYGGPVSRASFSVSQTGDKLKNPVYKRKAGFGVFK
jgi:hypothetical protein